MGSGLTYLLWYVMCGAVVALTVGVGAGLFYWGKRREKRERGQDPPS
ncbi:MAG: hypothetical protein OES69_10840 [Myxococcales bacterium]|jgi:hypothetical protein|nr:hypothetical protein [Myxococcales bacterium]MDH3844425.1 hypothetical protein [Myxococcales bacterium]